MIAAARCVRRAVEALPERLRAVVRARFYEGRDYGAIAAELGITEAAARQCWCRCRATLRRRLSPEIAE